jgi:putative peptidoglycan lipid II flippase
MVRDLLKKGLGAITSKQTSIFSAAVFIMLTTWFAYLLGFVKYRVFAIMYGQSMGELGVFFAAFKIPDFIFQVFIASALTSAFIPVFSDYLVKDDTKAANKFASSLMTLGTCVYIVFAIIVAIFAGQITSLIAPGLRPDEIALMTSITRIVIFSQVFFILGTIATGILQSLQHFLLPGIALALYNLGIIIGVLVLEPYFGIYGAVVGVFIGAFLYFVLQIPLLAKSGYKFRAVFEVVDEVKTVLKLMIPRSATALLVQISILATNVYFVSFISAKSIAILEFAQTLWFAPINLFGLSIAQATFPTLSKKAKDHPEFLAVLIPSINQILYLTLPVSVLLIVLRIPIVRLVYGVDAFDWNATVMTGMTLACLSISIAAQSLMYLLSRAFFALKNTKTPLVITAISVLVNVSLSYVFVLVLHKPVYFLALSLSIANILSAVLMLAALHWHIKLPKVEMAVSLSKILIATFIMGFTLYIPIKLLDQLVFDTTRTINLIILTGISSFLGLLSFLFFTWLLEIKEAYYILAVVKKFSSRTPILKNIGEIIDGPKLNT